VRTIHWLFVISVALFVGGIAFVIAAERTRSAAPSAAADMRAAAPVATVKQIMNGIVSPAATAIWDSVATDVTAAGVVEKVPRTDEEWAQVATNAALLVESANLLLEGDRAVDTGDWVTMAKAMAESGAKVLKAAESKRPQDILTSGDELNTTCDKCHGRYQRN
jgi:hypothetical protein